LNKNHEFRSRRRDLAALGRNDISKPGGNINTTYSAHIYCWPVFFLFLPFFSIAKFTPIHYFCHNGYRAEGSIVRVG
jgi:hypothetical protein